MPFGWLLHSFSFLLTSIYTTECFFLLWKHWQVVGFADSYTTEKVFEEHEWQINAVYLLKAGRGCRSCKLITEPFSIYLFFFYIEQPFHFFSMQHVIILSVFCWHAWYVLSKDSWKEVAGHAVLIGLCKDHHLKTKIEKVQSCSFQSETFWIGLTCPL